jgi:hypothetical protein
MNYYAKDRPVPGEPVYLQALPGFEGLKYYDINTSAFMSHTGGVIAVALEQLTLPEIHDLFNDENIVYIHSVYRTETDKLNDSYSIRYAVTQKNNTTLIRFSPPRHPIEWEIGLHLEINANMMEIRDAIAQWGKDEVSSFLGEMLYKAIVDQWNDETL